MKREILCDCISRIGIEGDEFGKWTCRSCKKEVFNKNRKEIKTMDYEKLDEVATKLESKYIPESAKGNLEAKKILAITQAYRILRIEINKSKT